MTTKTEQLEPRISNLLWATDFSEESLYCLPYVKDISRSVEGNDYGVFILPKFSDWIYETAFASDGELLETIEKTRQGSLDKIRDANKESGLSMEPVVLEGIASEEVLAFSKENDVDLIFAGRRGMSEIEHILIGSTTSRLIRNCEVPVCVIPKERKDAKVERILCPIDFNELSMWELEYAIHLSLQTKAKLYVAHISEFFNYKVPVFKRDKLISKINEKIIGIAEQHNYEIENIIYDEGEPGHKIIEIAKKNQIDLITMATHQRKGFEKLFLGSIVEKVLMYSDIPVIVLPPKVLEEQYSENGNGEYGGE